VLHTHEAYVKNILDNAKPAPGSLLHCLLDRHRDDFAISQPEKLRAIIANTLKMTEMASNLTLVEFLSECKDLFNYDKFSGKHTKGWNAYALCQSSEYQMCPYCQQAGALTIYRDPNTKSFHPTLDHFYPKAQYPYLALSLYNLVPSCHTCNSSLKSTADFYKMSHLHPYEDEELIRFDWDVDYYLEMRKGTGPMPGSLAKTGVTIRAVADGHKKSNHGKNSASTFLTEERLHLNIFALRLFQESVLLNSPDRIAEINRVVLANSHWKLSEETALQFSYNNYKNEWQGRLKRDLYEAARLIY
jgi:hypothetical protein